MNRQSFGHDTLLRDVGLWDALGLQGSTTVLVVPKHPQDQRIMYQTRRHDMKRFPVNQNLFLVVVEFCSGAYNKLKPKSNPEVFEAAPRP